MTRATLIILDGARPDVFRHLADRGDLPHLSRHLLEPGGITPATTVFPTTTGVAYLPFLTGCYPGTLNVPGIRWLDRARYAGGWWRDREHVRSYCGYQGGRLNHDLTDGTRSLFDLEPDSVALCTPFNRGLAPGRERSAVARALWGGLGHYTMGYDRLDQAVGREFARLAPQHHRFTFAVFPGVDGVAHFSDPWHPSVLDMYRDFDGLFGDFAAAGGMDGDHLVLLVSDHGFWPVERHTDIAVELEGHGVPVLRHPLHLWRRDPRAAVMVSGNGSAQVYFHPGILRESRYAVHDLEAGMDGLPAGIVSWLAALPGVGVVAGTDGDDVVVIGPSGRGRLTPATGERIAWRPETGDPLGLGPAAERTEREWLAASYAGPYPDAPMQLFQVFRSPRAGDLVVIAEPGADLRDDWELPEHRAGHGSLHGEHMRCLVAANRVWPGPIRTPDLFPVILDHLGIPVPSGIDGVAP